jgi:hypothetical protein
VSTGGGGGGSPGGGGGSTHMYVPALAMYWQLSEQQPIIPHGLPVGVHSPIASLDCPVLGGGSSPPPHATRGTAATSAANTNARPLFTIYLRATPYALEQAAGPAERMENR